MVSYQEQAPQPVSKSLSDYTSRMSDDYSVTPLGPPDDNPGPAHDSPMFPPKSVPMPTESFAELQNGRLSSLPSSWSVNSDRRLGYGGSASSNADPSDRVFPIRSVVSVDQSQSTPWPVPRNSADDYMGAGRRRVSNPRIPIERRPDTVPPSSSVGSPNDRDTFPRPSRKNTMPEPLGSRPLISERFTSSGSLALFTDTASEASTGTRESRSMLDAGGSQADDFHGRAPDFNEPLVTVRFRHVKTEGGHAVITGRDGNLQRCEDEPIHAPGAVQSFGLLVVLHEEADGSLSVRIVSENSKRIIGYTPQELFQLKSFTEVFSEEQADNILDHIDFIRDEDSDPATNGPDVFSLSVRPPKRRPTKLWCAMHINPNQPHLIICEFELEDDHQHPLRPPDEVMADGPEDTLYQNPTTEELHESTEVSSKPLRVLRGARKRRGEAGAMQVFDIMSQVQGQLASASSLDKFLKILVGIVKELTGFHRVMIYQFDASFNGKVVTELVDPVHTRDLYHGLHFPASDIPRQARELYKLNKVRLLYDRDLESARLVCRSTEDLEQPLDLSHAYLRAMSPIHLKYLGNMAVRSSMSISINAFDELWGLIACHTYGPKGMRVPFPIRKMCRLVGDNASRNIERLSYASRLQARKLINTVPTDKNPSGYIIASSEDLLRLFDADFGMLSIRGETKILGKMEQSQEALAMLEYLRLRSFTSVLTSQDIRDDFPDLRYPPGFLVIAGLLYVPLSIGGSDFIVFFRRGQTKEVKWAGNPYEKLVKEGTQGYLEPRTSFKAWHETIAGKCREWTDEQVETAAVLCLVYGKFIEVWRQKEAALQNSRLTRLLLSNSAHEVRTPLNAIINYLEIALEGSLDHETRENLAKSHSASKSLIYVINDLLDLTNTEEGQELIKDEIMDLPACVHEAADPFKADAKRKGVSYEIVEHPGLPRYVHGDYRRVRQAIANMTANAVKHTTEGYVKVELYVVEVLESRVRVEIVVHDSGCGMNHEKVDSLFQDLEQVTTDVDESVSIESQVEKTPEKRTLGLGLAVVARIVRNMDGQLRLKSEEGKGSRFVIQLPFDLPTSDSLDKIGTKEDTSVPSQTASLASVSTTIPPAEDGERLLVDGASSALSNIPPQLLHEKRSFEEAKSVSSLVSGGSISGRSNKSDAARLIDAISMPLNIGDTDDDTTSLQRKASKGAQHNANASTTSLPETYTFGPVVPERPTSLRRSNTASAQALIPEPGTHQVTDNKTPIKSVKVPDEYVDQPKSPQTGQSSKILFEIPATPEPDAGPVQKTTNSPAPLTSKLRVLVAEDDPINLRILKKRLEKSGHDVHHAVNGEDCATLYKEAPTDFDIILMDMQMPIVDGLTSTKMIRAFEQSGKCPRLSSSASNKGRIPIFAVSASLVEKEKSTYVDAGFDGWILKPVDFKRLNILLEGILNDEVREGCLYELGEWERGGWLVRRSPDGGNHPNSDSDDADATPTGKKKPNRANQYSFVTLPNTHIPGPERYR